MILRAIIKGKQIIIPNYWNLKDGEILIDVKLLKDNEKVHGKEVKETAIALIEHWKDDIKKEISLNPKKIKEAAKKLGLKGITVKDLINEEF